MWKVRNMEACGASNDVELMLRTICGLYTFGSDLDNGIVDWLHIWLRERLEITLSGCQPSAAWRPVRDHPFLESLVVAELLPHIVLHATQRLALGVIRHDTWPDDPRYLQFFGILIDWVVSEEHPEHTHHTLFDVVPILEMVVPCRLETSASPSLCTDVFQLLWGPWPQDRPLCC